MCGIAGMIDWRAATSADALRSIGEAMIETVRHRGPDAGAVWVEAESGAALGQRRLAIIDLSPGGGPPPQLARRPPVPFLHPPPTLTPPTPPPPPAAPPPPPRP